MVSVSSYMTSKGKRWRVRYRTADGRNTDKRGFTLKREADAYALQVTVDKPLTVSRRADGLRFENVCREFIRLKRKAVSRSTLIGYVQALNSFLPELANKPVDRITRRDIQRIISAIQLSPATITLRTIVLHQLFVFAIDMGYCTNNPCVRIIKPKILKKPHQYLTLSQLVQLADSMGEWRWFILFSGFVGTRLGETSEIRCKDINFDRREILISRSCSSLPRETWVKTVKSGVARTVSYPSQLDPLVNSLRDSDPETLLFPTILEQVYKMRAKLKRECDRLGFPTLRVHDLRHTCASLLISCGGNVKAVQNQLGHASAQMTLDVYADLFDTDRARLIERLSERIGTL